MTATYPRRADLVLRGVVYGIDLLDHASVMADAPRIVPDDYVGQTTQRGRGRENQHRDDKPWSDLIVGSPRTLWEADCTGKQLDEQERHFIQDGPPEGRPRMNWKLNEDNPFQIPKWVQLEQRHERDRKFGRPLWQPPELRNRESLLEWSDRASPVRQNKPAPTRRQKFLIGWVCTWLASMIATVVGLLHSHLANGTQTLIAAPLALPALLLAGWLLLLWKAGKRRRRRIFRFLTGRSR
jgi:hypothetical protein